MSGIIEKLESYKKSNKFHETKPMDFLMMQTWK